MRKFPTNYPESRTRNTASYNNSPKTTLSLPSDIDLAIFDHSVLTERERSELSGPDPVVMLSKARVRQMRVKAGGRRRGYLTATSAYHAALQAKLDPQIVNRILADPVFEARKYKPNLGKVLLLTMCYAFDGITVGDPEYSTAGRYVKALEPAFMRGDEPGSVFAELIKRGVVAMCKAADERKATGDGQRPEGQMEIAAAPKTASRQPADDRDEEDGSVRSEEDEVGVDDLLHDDGPEGREVAPHRGGGGSPPRREPTPVAADEQPKKYPFDTANEAAIGFGECYEDFMASAVGHEFTVKVKRLDDLNNWYRYVMTDVLWDLD